MQLKHHNRGEAQAVRWQIGMGRGHLFTKARPIEFLTSVLFYAVEISWLYVKKIEKRMNGVNL